MRPPRLLPPCRQQNVEAILEEARQCAPSAWDSKQLEASNHVTSAKHSKEEKQRLLRVLAAQPNIRRHLCDLTHALGYTSEFCPQQ